jgi:hypothetical protein
MAIKREDNPVIKLFTPSANEHPACALLHFNCVPALSVRSLQVTQTGDFRAVSSLVSDELLASLVLKKQFNENMFQFPG